MGCKRCGRSFASGSRLFRAARSKRPVPTIVRCPICRSAAPEIIRTFTVDQVATHSVPAARDPDRHRELRALLGEMWNGRESVDIHQCERCSFGFANPFVAGDQRFYNLVVDDDPSYPASRWEFDRTIEALSSLPGDDPRPGRLLDVGAGTGAFLKRLRSSQIAGRYVPYALEYDRGALRQLHDAGFQGSSRSLQDVAAATDESQRFSVICVFQTLHHIADVHGTFGALSDLLQPGGDIFISVPFGPETEVQERLTGYWDLPPIHVARWTSSAFEAAAPQHSLDVVAVEPEPINRLIMAGRLALYATLASAYDEQTLAGRINALPRRSLRGPAKRLLAVAYLPRMLAAWRSLSPRTRWVHIRHGDPIAAVQTGAD
jgi:SAM-dependent methyltransferase